MGQMPAELGSVVHAYVLEGAWRAPTEARESAFGVSKALMPTTSSTSVVPTRCVVMLKFRRRRQ